MFKQVKGLPIGPRATSGIARIVMNDLDELVGEALEKLRIELDLHIRYMDDIRMLLRRIIAGTVLVDGRLKIDPEVARCDNESGSPEVEATARFLRDLLNSLIPGIRFTTETWQQDFQDH